MSQTLSGKKPSPNEPVGEMRKIPIVECGEPLVDFTKECPELVLTPPVFRYKRETYLRSGFLERLCQAARSLPKGFRLGIYEGWRPPHIQRRMYLAIERQFRERYPDIGEPQLRRLVNRFSAPMDRRAPPPHMTGGAADVWLLREDGTRVDMRAPFGFHDDRAFPFDAGGITPEARRYRDLMAEALRAKGITNYPSEYWHWTYGDQGWAYRGGHDHALYGATQPEAWTPHAEDVNDEPLVFVDSH